MTIQITTRRCHVPQKVLDRTEEQVERLKKYDAHIAGADVVFEEEKLSRTIEIVLRFERGEPLVAKGDGPDFRSALDKAIDRLGRMVRKQRDRKVDHKAPPLSEGVISE